MSVLSLPGGLTIPQQAQLLAASIAAPATDYTAARAGKLDVLGAGGAGELTPARAALLANLNAALSSRLTSVVNSIQVGTADIGGATSITITISAVVVAKTMLILLGSTLATTGATFAQQSVSCTLTNTTTITIRRGASDAQSCPVSVVAVEFK